jgi:hypothetical protein
MNSTTAAPKHSGDAQEIEPDTCFETFGEKGLVENGEMAGVAGDNVIVLLIGEYGEFDNVTV